MSSHSSNCMEIFPNVEESSSSVDLEQLTQELSPASSEHVMSSLDRGIYIPELGRRISSINQLTRQQRASLPEDQLISIFSYMANHPSAMGSSLTKPRWSASAFRGREFPVRSAQGRPGYIIRGAKRTSWSQLTSKAGQSRQQKGACSAG